MPPDLLNLVTGTQERIEFLGIEPQLKIGAPFMHRLQLFN